MTAADDALRRNAELGAENLCTRCLRLAPGERLLVAHHDAHGIDQLVVRAAEACGARLRVVRLEPLAAEPPQRVADGCAALFADVQASVVIATGGLPAALSVALVRAAEAARTRHVHVPRASLAVLGSSGRADPERIARINELVALRLRRSPRLTVRSDAGTRLEVVLEPARPIVMDSGAPAPGRWDNLPSGFVYFHPASVDGRYVVDRNVIAPGLSITGAACRRAPLAIDLRAGRLTGRACTDDATLAAFDALVAGERLLERVGFVSLPTNYLVRTELGDPSHDSLLAGARLCLGFSDAPNTGAPFDTVNGIRLAGRGQTVAIGAEVIVEKGRLADAIARGLDPFRG